MTDNQDSEALVRLLSSSVIFRINRANNVITNCSTLLAKHEAQLNLADWRMLVFLGKGYVDTAAEIVNHTKYDPAFVSRSLNSIIKQGYVLSEPDPVDKRINRLRLTEKGLETYDVISRVVRKHVVRLEEGFSEQDLAKFFEMLDKIETAASEVYEEYREKEQPAGAKKGASAFRR